MDFLSLSEARLSLCSLSLSAIGNIQVWGKVKRTRVLCRGLYISPTRVRCLGPAEEEMKGRKEKGGKGGVPTGSGLYCDSDT